MRIWRERYPEPRLPRAIDLVNLPHDFPIQIAGMVICRQRHGTAKGHCFISLEDETAYRLLIAAESFLLASGRIQIGEGDQTTLCLTAIEPLSNPEAAHATGIHDFH
ncbi:hypothetical protein [Haloferula sp. BvORR071]|uniref:hypothetical protein n=1 Tax=Haloferula sp. BvORR071 TaxID=1396141 RepID=UPI0006964F2A|nr:hypothetical protein [Haloferula sp. BvORR071]